MPVSAALDRARDCERRGDVDAALDALLPFRRDREARLAIARIFGSRGHPDPDRSPEPAPVRTTPRIVWRRALSHERGPGYEAFIVASPLAIAIVYAHTISGGRAPRRTVELFDTERGEVLACDALGATASAYARVALHQDVLLVAGGRKPKLRALARELSTGELIWEVSGAEAREALARAWASPRTKPAPDPQAGWPWVRSHERCIDVHQTEGGSRGVREGQELWRVPVEVNTYDAGRELTRITDSSGRQYLVDVSGRLTKLFDHHPERFVSAIVRDTALAGVDGDLVALDAHGVELWRVPSLRFERLRTLPRAIVLLIGNEVVYLSDA